jgi:hypothetical protein
VLAQEDGVKPFREAPQILMSSAGILLTGRVFPEAVSDHSGATRIQNRSAGMTNKSLSQSSTIVNVHSILLAIFCGTHSLSIQYDNLLSKTGKSRASGKPYRRNLENKWAVSFRGRNISSDDNLYALLVTVRETTAYIDRILTHDTRLCILWFIVS